MSAEDVRPIGARRPNRAVLVRPRLNRSLDRLTALTIVAAPRGAGKSVMLETWLTSVGVGSSTVALVPEVRQGGTPSGFWSSVSECLGAAGVGGGVGSGYARVDSQLTGMTTPLVLMLQHPDRVASEDLEAQLSDLLDRHHDLHLVVCMRTGKLFRGRLGVDAEYQVVGRADLLFTRAETGAWLAQSGVELASDIEDALHEHLGGIPRLVRALTPVLWRLPGADIAEAVAIADEAVCALVAEEALSPRGSDCASAALAACDVLGTVTASQITGMTGQRDPGAELADINDIGLVQIASGPGVEAAWTMVPALRSAVQALLTADHSERYTRQLSRLGSWCREGGDYSGALACGLRAENWDEAWPVLRDHWADLVSTDMTLIREALVRMPADLVQRQPGFGTWRALCTAMDAGFVAVKAEPTQVEEGLADVEGEAKPLAAVVSEGSVRSAVLRLAGDFRAASEMAHWLQTLVEGANEEDLAATASFLAFMRVQWGMNHQLASDLDSSDVQYRLAYSGSVGGRNDLVARNAVGGLALNSALRGEIARATDLAEVEAGYADVPGYRGPKVDVPGKVARVLVAVQRRDMETAERELAVLGLPSDMDELWAPIVLAHCAVALALGTPDVGLDLLHRAEAPRSHLALGSSLAHQLLTVAASHLYLSSGRGNEALAVLPDLDSGTGDSSGVLRVCRARVHLLIGDPATALAQVQGMVWEDGAQPGPSLNSLVIAGAAQCDLGELDLARQTLLRACALSSATGLTAPLCWLPRALEERLLIAGVVPDVLREIWSQPGRVWEFPDEVRLVFLTTRELEIMRLLDAGVSSADLAERLFVSRNTVKSQMRSAYRKLDSNSRNEAVSKARELGLL